MHESVELTECLAAYAAGTTASRDTERTAVKQILAGLAAAAPGKSVELRIPPYAAIQIVEGTNHRRGTPAAVVEMSARVLISLAVGTLTWDDAIHNGQVSASGERSNISRLFPC